MQRTSVESSLVFKLFYLSLFILLSYIYLSVKKGILKLPRQF